ncbi:Transposase DDE domain-containing protein [Streptomyces sp. SolWspMP-5a-2]|nr:Transposase DDE domain-containing protein [Streptomyces sp. SolWspMP-5a-2]
MSLLLTPGQWGDAPRMIEVLDRIRVPRPRGGRPRTRPDHVSGDKANSSRRNRRYLRRRDIRHTIPEPQDQRSSRRTGSDGGRPVGFDRDRYRRRNEVERTVNRLKNSPARSRRVTTNRAYVFHGTVTAAAIRLWPRQ